MSEYLSKKAVLEWLDDRRYKSPWIESFRERLESGAFDAEPDGWVSERDAEFAKVLGEAWSFIKSDGSFTSRELKEWADGMDSDLCRQVLRAVIATVWCDRQNFLRRN